MQNPKKLHARTAEFEIFKDFKKIQEKFKAFRSTYIKKYKFNLCSLYFFFVMLLIGILYVEHLIALREHKTILLERIVQGVSTVLMILFILGIRGRIKGEITEEPIKELLKLLSRLDIVQKNIDCTNYNVFTHCYYKLSFSNREDKQSRDFIEFYSSKHKMNLRVYSTGEIYFKAFNEVLNDWESYSTVSVLKKHVYHDSGCEQQDKIFFVGHNQAHVHHARSGIQQVITLT